MTERYTGRLAPSPTGYLHVGNAWAFLVAWLEARKSNGKLILRMEDIDPDRSKEEFAQEIRNDLKWLGLDWDEEVKPQSKRTAIYKQAIDRLKERDLIYPCFCTRKELRELAGAPHIGDTGVSYPGTCRNLSKELINTGKPYALRLKTDPDKTFAFNDLILGKQEQTLQNCGGDFALMRSDGVYAYQLAVVLDDIDAGITHVIRGTDILPSTARQLYLYDLFEEKVPAYAHVPLVVDGEGERLAKRHQSLTLKSLQNRGTKPEAVIGKLAYFSGILEKEEQVSAKELAGGVDLSKIKKQNIVLPDEIGYK